MSKLSVGIVGLPNVGKSTLFKALTKADINVANYPFATIDPNVGVVSVPDERLDRLSELSKSEKKVPAIVEFYDIAGLVRGANKGEGLGNQFLSHIREVSIIVHVVRAFKLDDITHVEGSVDPLRDIETINTELVLKDLEIIESRLDKVTREAKTGDKVKQKELAIIQKVFDVLSDGSMASVLGEEWLEEECIAQLGLLSSKPQILLFNGSEEDVLDDVLSKVNDLGFDHIIVDLGDEVDLANLIRESYKTLDLITFFTTGPKETRGWTLRKGSFAPQAGGVIHSDFEDKFIRAEVVSTDKLLEAGGWSQAKAKGWVKTEGKTYVIQDGDVILIHHS